MRDVTIERIVFAGLALFLFVGLFLVDDYGMNTDSRKNFREGEMNLDYILTGRVDRDVLQWQMHGALILAAADAAERLFHDGLHLVGTSRRWDNGLGRCPMEKRRRRQYVSADYRNLFSRHGMICSMTRKGKAECRHGIGIERERRHGRTFSGTSSSSTMKSGELQ